MNMIAEMTGLSDLSSISPTARASGCPRSLRSVSTDPRNEEEGEILSLNFDA